MNSRQILVRAATAFAALCAIGCGSDKDSLEKRVGALREEVVALQNNNDRLAERLMAIEMRQDQAAPARTRAATSSETETSEGNIERPPLKVVRLAPGSKEAPAAEKAAEAAEMAEDETPRPMIRDLGSGRRARTGAAPGAMRQTPVRAEPSAGEL